MVITGKKDAVFLEFKELDILKNRAALAKFVIEEALLVKRAVNDGLAVEKIVYTERFLRDGGADACLVAAKTAGVSVYKINDGLLGAVTTTRPLPSVIASVSDRVYDVNGFAVDSHGALLITDSVSNPDNLGMILRTADASGVGGVAVIGEGASVYHKNCVRAARGAVGRLPIITGKFGTHILTVLKQNGVTLIGTSADAKRNIYQLEYKPPAAFIVGNENHGISPEVLAQCHETVNIPMLAGRDSLSVAVAAGVVIYEWVRRNSVFNTRQLYT